MVNLDYDNHLEVHLRPNKKDPPPSDNGLRFAATLTLTFTLTFALEMTGTLNLFPESEAMPPPGSQRVSAPEPRPTPGPPEDVPPQPAPFYPPPSIAPQPDVEDASGGGGEIPWVRDVQINYCSGYFAAANFRAYADYDPFAISGKVLPGDWVALTGRTYFEDGILWYQAINYAPLERSEDGYDSYYQPQANQYGWIASCFVE